MDVEIRIDRSQVQKIRRTALAISIVSTQVLVLFPLLVCGKVYFYPDIRWVWLLPLPQIAGVVWAAMLPDSGARILGATLLLISPLLIFLTLQGTTTWPCHLSLLPVYITMLRRTRRCPLGLILSIQLHFEGCLSLINDPKLVIFDIPEWPSVLGLAVFVSFLVFICLLPLAVLSFFYLISQVTRCIVLLCLIWITLGFMLSLNAAKAISVPLILISGLTALCGFLVAFEAAIVYVDWRRRLQRMTPLQYRPRITGTRDRRTSGLMMRGLSGNELGRIPLQIIGDHTLLPSSINSSPKQQATWDDNSFELVCTICQDELLPGSFALVIPECHHAFHPDCVAVWLKQRPLCPNCNLNVRATLLSETVTTSTSSNSMINEVSTGRSLVSRFATLLSVRGLAITPTSTPRGPSRPPVWFPPLFRVRGRTTVARNLRYWARRVRSPSNENSLPHQITQQQHQQNLQLPLPQQQQDHPQSNEGPSRSEQTLVVNIICHVEDSNNDHDTPVDTTSNI